MKRIAPLLFALLLLLAGCGGNAADSSYQQITQEEAKEMIDIQEVIILDVREQDEYDGSHMCWELRKFTVRYSAFQSGEESF